MRDDDLDRILSQEEEILPSSGFAASVMDAVRQESSMPAPIPFPWKRALPGVVAAALTLVLAVVATVAHWNRGSEVQRLPAEWWPIIARSVEVATSTGMGWIALALLLTLVSVMFSLRLAFRRT
jgi:hypothetical protein